MGKIAELLALRRSYFFNFSEAVIIYSSASLISHFVLMDVLLRATIIVNHHKKDCLFSSLTRYGSMSLHFYQWKCTMPFLTVIRTMAN